MAATERRVRVVCFDLGGVLLRLVHGWSEACARAGVRAAGAVDGFHPLHRRFERGDLSEEAFVSAVAARGGYEPDAIRAIVDAWLIDLYPGVSALLDRIRVAGLTTACLTNTNARHWRMLADPWGRFGALAKLDHRFASHLLAARKPDPAVHRCVEGRLGAAPEEILFLDDRPENVEGARVCGWRAERVDTPREITDQVVGQLRRHRAW